MSPETRYAQSGDVNIAYQVVGDGPRDLIYVPGFVSNIEIFWEEPALARFLMRLASFARLILFDKRGTGLSDRVTDVASLEVRIDDVRAVMDAVGSERAALFGYSEGGAMCAMFAAAQPQRASALIMFAGFARWTRCDDYPYGLTEEEVSNYASALRKSWADTATGIEQRAPSMAHDPHFRGWWARHRRMSASPAAAEANIRMCGEIDIRSLLPSIRVPTLLLHSLHDRCVGPQASRYMAERIAGAKLIELPGSDHVPWLSDGDAIADEIEEFLTGVRPMVEADRVLATVLFTDIVGSTQMAAGLGDRRWHDLLDRHHAIVRSELERFRGREIDTAGDGFLASFDGPARAVRCACAISQAMRSLGLEVRAGLHTGECERIGSKLGGIAVHIGARVAALAEASEVLVSGTVKDLVAGSGLAFADRGTRALRGVPGEWRLYSVRA